MKGFINYLKDHNPFEYRDISIEERATERVHLGICSLCEHYRSIKLITKLPDAFYPKAKGKICNITKKPLSFVVRANTKCPINNY